MRWKALIPKIITISETHSLWFDPERMLKFTEDIWIEATQYAIKMCGNYQGEELFHKLKRGKKYEVSLKLQTGCPQLMI